MVTLPSSPGQDTPSDPASWIYTPRSNTEPNRLSILAAGFSSLQTERLYTENLGSCSIEIPFSGQISCTGLFFGCPDVQLPEISLCSVTSLSGFHYSSIPSCDCRWLDFIIWWNLISQIQEQWQVSLARRHCLYSLRIIIKKMFLINTFLLPPFNLQLFFFPVSRGTLEHVKRTEKDAELTQ